MKRLFIIRHAKSSWDDMSLSDFDRPLNKRGKKNAPFMAKRLKTYGVKPDLILCSPALRAKKTAKEFAKKLKISKEISFDDCIYEASSTTLFNLLRKQNKKHDTILLFGHNPGLNMLADSLVGFYDNIPTCGIVEIEFTCQKWSDISSDNARLISFDYPKKYKVEDN